MIWIKRKYQKCPFRCGTKVGVDSTGEGFTYADGIAGSIVKPTKTQMNNLLRKQRYQGPIPTQTASMFVVGISGRVYGLRENCTITLLKDS